MRRTRSSLGDLTSTLVTAAQVTSDPYFQETVCHVGQLAAIERRQPVPGCTPTPKGLAGGVGLRKIQPLLRAYVYAEQNPWAYAVGAAALFGVPFLLGMAFARGGRS